MGVIILIDSTFTKYYYSNQISTSYKIETGIINKDAQTPYIQMHKKYMKQRKKWMVMINFPWLALRYLESERSNGYVWIWKPTQKAFVLLSQNICGKIILFDFHNNTHKILKILLSFSLKLENSFPRYNKIISTPCCIQNGSELLADYIGMDHGRIPPPPMYFVWIKNWIMSSSMDLRLTKFSELNLQFGLCEIGVLLYLYILKFSWQFLF